MREINPNSVDKRADYNKPAQIELGRILPVLAVGYDDEKFLSECQFG